MFLEAVTVSVNYGDFLAWTIKENRHHFGYNKWGQSNWIIVTDTKDKHTKTVCDYYNVRCIQTDVFYEDGDVFNKAKGINAGLEVLSCNDWVLHIDADIYLPPNFRKIIDKYPLDTLCVYGWDRYNCKSFDTFVEFLTYPKLLHEDWVFTHMNRFEIGTRIVRYNDEGYIPIGFSQLWHPTSSGFKMYPTMHGTAARTDMLFAQQWPSSKRRFIPDFVAIHIESEASEKMGANWNGRSTPYFGPIKKNISTVVQKENFIEQNGGYL